MKKGLFCSAALAAVALLLFRAEETMRYASDAVRMCAEIIVPTLFPFFVCSELLIYSGFCSILSRLAGGAMRPLFNVAPAGAAALVIGIISGFPQGAVTVCRLYRCGSLSKVEAERLLAFSGNSGPLFVIGSIGAAIYGQLSLGIMLYVIHLLSSFLVGILFRFYGAGRHSSPPMRLDTEPLPLSDAFSRALSDAARGIITVCAAIVFFAAVSRAALDLLPLPPVLRALATGLCEFSGGTLAVSELDIDICEKLIMTSFIVGFSGISVHLQVMTAVSGSGLSLKPYMLGKLLHGSFSAVLTLTAMRVISRAVYTFSPASAPLSASCAAAPAFLAIASAALLAAGVLKRKKHY